MAARLSIITTCKGRLPHLKQTLPRMAAQPDCECIVVDYDCPDRTRSWVGASFPDVRLVNVDDAPVFNAAMARNLGARAARTEWLVFVDADVLVDAGFSRDLEPVLRRRYFFRPTPLTAETCGTFACHRGDFFALSGYDEILEGYGGEDNDIYLRLGHAGCTMQSFDGALIQSIPHDAATRTEYHEVRNIELNRRINSLYNHIKYDLICESGLINLPMDTRRAIYLEVRKTLLAYAEDPTASASITINLPVKLFLPVPDGWTIRRRWTFEMARTSGNRAADQ
ncbi:MAG: glycosyltransferase family A protein [Rhodocyclales bacterium]|nr:glycosyltransferase family A protein [Rhodocyclales bacterium]